MNRIWLDAKKLLLGQDGSENTPADFKDEISASVNNNVISKAMATLLLTARNNADKLGKEIEEKQKADVSGKGSRVSKNRDIAVEKNIEQAEIKKEKIIKKNKEQEEKRRKEESLRQTMQRIAQEEELRENNTRTHRQKRRLEIVQKNKYFLFDKYGNLC